MPDNNDDEKNTLDTTDDQKQTSNTLTTDADADNSTKDGPHQGRHDIGGYVPTN